MTRVVDFCVNETLWHILVIYSDANKIYMYLYLICINQSNFDITNDVKVNNVTLRLLKVNSECLRRRFWWHIVITVWFLYQLSLR